MSWGIKPQAAIGHSIREYVAATIAGVFSLEDALDLVALRGKLMQQMPTGSMLAVSLPEAEVQKLLDDELFLAAINAPNLCVISGSVDVSKISHQSLYQYGMRSPATSINAFERSLTLVGLTQVAISSGDLQARIREWIELKSLPTKELANNQNLFSKHQRPNLDIDYVAPRN